MGFLPPTPALWFYWPGRTQKSALQTSTPVILIHVYSGPSPKELEAMDKWAW